ncbi:hypothetical protein [Gemella morbillorum]|uniref:hypothetical protein n=1 Tax=Gemella morbillorum TaxID=29391 RepID=UPI00248DD021|nr:hypothetical protein [Gemella morbillorum]
MIELIVRKYLVSKLDIPVVLEYQKNLPKRYILLEKTSGKRNNYLNSSTIAIQSYAESLLEAAKLNEKIKNIMYDLVAVDEVSRVDLNSDYNFTDTETKQYRYQAVFDINYY